MRQPRPRPRRAPLAVALVCAVALSAAACGNSGGTSSSGGGTSTSSSSPATPATALHVTISGFTFHPDHFVVAPGATLTVTNHDPQPHTFTSTAGEFNTGDITQGQTVTLTAPRKKGTYPFKCTVHPFMTGSFQVR